MRFDLLFGVGDGVGEPFFRFAEAVGDGVGVGVGVECFRCLRLGVGLGSDSRALLIFEPNDSSAEGAATTAPNKITKIKSHFISRCCRVRSPQRRFESSGSAGCPEDSARYSTWRSADRTLAGLTDKMSVLRLREFLKDCFVQTNSAFEVFERKIFVRRVCAAIGQGESHKQRFNAKNFPEFRDDRDAAPFAD